MVTVAKASLLSDLESQREQELAAARAIQGRCERRMPRSAINSSLSMKWAATFWIFFTLTDGVIGIDLGDVTRAIPVAATG
jgi:hypothetical protein